MPDATAIAASPPLNDLAAPSAPNLAAPNGAAFVAVDLRASDGTPLSARFYRATSQPRGAVLLVTAMGVPQGYYGAFGSWLAGEGFHVLTFDFRGMGESLRGRLRDVDVDVVQWAERDATAALRLLEELAPGLPITWIGHSLGGQIVPFVRDRGAVAKVVTVAAGSGYWKQNAAPLRRKVWLFWFGAVPLATPIFGYFPGRALGMVGDLPRGVVNQWRRWCLDPEYAVGAGGAATRALFAGVETPITALSFVDDEMMSEANVRSLHGFYSGAPVDVRRIAPSDVGVKRIGHFGFFKREMRAPLWDAHLLPELATSTALSATSAARDR